jgi:putative endonuclease
MPTNMQSCQLSFPQLGQAPARAKKARRRAAETLGRQAEDDVACLLQKHGFDILALRLKTGAGEIDIVAADAQRLIFVEVKARPSFTEAAYAVSARQQARLVQAASIALARNEAWARPEIRFDAALVTGGGIRIIKDVIRIN